MDPTPEPLETIPHEQEEQGQITLDRVVVCVACGGVCKPSVPPYRTSRKAWDYPMLLKAKRGFLGWDLEPQALRRWSRENYNHPNEDPIDFYGVLKFEGGPEGFTNWHQEKADINTADAEMFLPIHVPCHELAKKFCEYQLQYDKYLRCAYIRGNGAPTTIARLYGIWMNRAKSALPGLDLGPLQCPIPEPTNYGGITMSSNLTQYMNMIHQRSEPAIEEHDPIGGRFDATVIVARHITVSSDGPIPHGPKPHDDFWWKMGFLPDGVQKQVRLMLMPLDLDRSQIQCTRLMPPGWWRYFLFKGELIPWLYDLDLSYVSYFVNTKFGPVDLEDGVDWELLCRKLAMPYVFESEGILAGDKRLENRRRIWRLLESARLGDGVSGESLRYSQ